MADDLVTVATRMTAVEAHLCRGLLESERVPAFVMDELSGDQLAPSYTGSYVQVQVPMHEVGRARAILERAKRREKPRRGMRVAEEHAQRTGTAGSIVLGVLLLLLGWVATFAILLLALNGVTDLRGQSGQPPWLSDDPTLADSLVLLLGASGVALLTAHRARLCLRWEFVAGQWLAVALLGLFILAR